MTATLSPLPSAARTMICAVALAAVSSCTGADIGRSPSSGQLESIPVGGMPFDVFPGDALEVVDDAVSQGIAECVAAAGFPELLEVQIQGGDGDSTILDGDRLTASSFGPTDETTARRDGLREQPNPQPPQIVSSDPSFDAEAERCSTEVMDAIGSGVQEAITVFYELYNEASGRMFAAFGGPEFRELRRAQLECLVGLGFIPSDEEAYLREGREDVFGFQFGEEVVGTPGEVPSNEPGTVQVLQPPRDVRYVPTPGEVEFALADLQCRRSTGFDEAFLEEARRVQAEIIDDLEPQLIDLTEDLDRLARAAADEVAD